MRKKLFRWLVVVLIVVAAAVTYVVTRQSSKPLVLTIATASEGGTFYPLGTHLARFVEDLPERSVTEAHVWKTPGSSFNLELLLRPQRTYYGKPDYDRLNDGVERQDDSADIAFVGSSALEQLRKMNPDALNDIRGLATLYTEVIQVVVREPAAFDGEWKIKSLRDLPKDRIYAGQEGGATRLFATEILRGVDLLGPDEVLPTTEYSYSEAAKRLLIEDDASNVDERIDAAIFLAGTPTDAVRQALESGKCRLLDLREHLDHFKHIPGLVITEVPTSFYANQPYRVHSVGANALLLSRRELPDHIVSGVLAAIFDNSSELLVAHSKAEDIQLHTALAPADNARPDELLPGVAFHRAALNFRAEEESKLLLLTGAINGRYFKIGRAIESLLNQRGIPARALHTQGSVENARRLGDRPSLAILQYDVALAIAWGDPSNVYDQELPEGIRLPHADRLRRIVTLHQEEAHIIIRADKLGGMESRLAAETQPMVEILNDYPQSRPPRICLGPSGSGSQLLARVVLARHGVEERPEMPFRHLTVPDMVNRLHGGELDVGFFTAGVPSGALKNLLSDPRFRLLSVDPRKMGVLRHGAFDLSRIEPETYGCQREGDSFVRTVSTQAVLVTSEDLPYDVAEITRAIFEGADYFGSGNGVKGLAKELSLEVHPSALAYYQEAGHAPAPPRISWLGVAAQVAAILVILGGAYNGLLKIRRDNVSSEISRRLFAVSVEASEQRSSTMLTQLRREIRSRVRKRWWEQGEIDESRFKVLDSLIRDGIEEAKENLSRELVGEIRQSALAARGDETSRREERDRLRERLWSHLANGELTAEQHRYLVKIMEDKLQSESKAAAET